MISLPFIAQHVTDKKLVLSLTRLSFPFVRFSLYSEQSTKRRSRSETCKRFVYSLVKITRLYDYQTWQTHLLRNSEVAQGFVGFFLWLCFSDADWISRQTPLICRAKDENRQKDHSASREVWTIERQLVFCNRTSYIPTAFSVSGPGLRTKPWVWNYVRNAI